MKEPDNVMLNTGAGLLVSAPQYSARNSHDSSEDCALSSYFNGKKMGEFERDK